MAMLVVIIILFGKISIELELCRPRSRRTWQDNLKIGLKNVNEPYHEFDRVAQVIYNWGILVNLQILYTVKLIIWACTKLFKLKQYNYIMLNLKFINLLRYEKTVPSRLHLRKLCFS